LYGLVDGNIGGSIDRTEDGDLATIHERVGGRPG
jgi:hypothetical protein